MESERKQNLEDMRFAGIFVGGIGLLLMFFWFWMSDNYHDILDQKIKDLNSRIEILNEGFMRHYHHGRLIEYRVILNTTK